LALSLNKPSQYTYPEEAVDAIQTIGRKQLVVHLIEMTPVITPVTNENMQRIKKFNMAQHFK